MAHIVLVSSTKPTTIFLGIFFSSCFAEFFVTYTADITPFANVYVYYIKVHLLFGQLSLPVAVAVN